MAGLGSDRCRAGRGRARESGGCCVYAPGSSFSLAFPFQTKEVQKAMDEKRFDEAIQLRGR